MAVLPVLQSRAEAAHLLVALSSVAEKKALLSAAVARNSLSAISSEYEGRVGALWESANKEALNHLLLVMGNNPHKPVEALLKRADVESALRWPYEQAAKKSEALIREAWEKAEKDSLAKAKGEMKLLKVDWKGHETDEGLLENLVSDLHANAKAMRSRYHKVLTEGSDKDKALKTLTGDATRRARFSLTVGVWSVAAQIRESAARLAGLNRMWVSRMDSATCTHCKALHGYVVGPTEAFPVTGLKTYRDLPLYGPPRHPQCRCVVVFTLLPKTVLKKTKSKTQKTS